MTQSWQGVVNYVLNHEDCKTVHKLVWKEAGLIFLTDTTGYRVKMNSGWTIMQVKELISKAYFKSKH